MSPIFKQLVPISNTLGKLLPALVAKFCHHSTVKSPVPNWKSTSFAPVVNLEVVVPAKLMFPPATTEPDEGEGVGEGGLLGDIVIEGVVVGEILILGVTEGEIVIDGDIVLLIVILGVTLGVFVTEGVTVGVIVIDGDIDIDGVKLGVIVGEGGGNVSTLVIVIYPEPVL